MKAKVLAILSLLGLVSADDSNFIEGSFQQKLDHYNSLDKREFAQRFWYNDKNFDKTNGPVFLDICGEGTCKPPNERDYSVELCRELKCLYFALEHRYYGSSQPFPDWSTDNLKYLNSTLALADLDYFIKDRNQWIDQQWGAGVRKWITIGGSYPGALSAWFKSQYPLDVAAAWSSSGVINPIKDYTDYDLDIYQATSRSGSYCPTEIKAIVDYVEKAITGDKSVLTQEDIDYVYDLFEIKDLDNGDFMYYFADIFAGSVQYGKRAYLCNILQSMQGVDIK